MSSIVVKDATRRIISSTWPSVEKALKARLEELSKDPTRRKEYLLAQKRYPGLTAKDVYIEPVRVFEDGRRLVCFSTRKTGFARMDLEIQPMEAAAILSSISRKAVTVEDREKFEEYLQTPPPVDTLVYVISEKRWYGFIPGVDVQAELHVFMTEVFFNSVTCSDEVAPFEINGHHNLNFADPAVVAGGNNITIIDVTRLTTP